MTEETKTQKEEIKEVKASFSIKYMLRMILSASIIAFIGWLTTYLLTEKPNKELIIYSSDSKRLLNDNALPKEIIANYLLKGKENNPNKKISSLFLKTILIRNTGNRGAENVPLVVYIKNKNIFLIDDPEIKTIPKGIMDLQDIKKTKNSTNNKHTWNIPLLKPNETVMFEYMIYSEKKVENYKINILSRNKDWNVKKGTILDKEKERKANGMDVPIVVIIIIVISYAIIGFYNFFLSSKNFRLRTMVKDLLHDKAIKNSNENIKFD